MVDATQILEFWFGPFGASYPANNHATWWEKNETTDELIARKFSDALQASARGELAGWSRSSEGRQAHIILVDQMARNMHRDRAEMYAQDELAVRLALEALEAGDPWGRRYRELQFFLMPLMHAEDVALQRESCRMFGRALSEAIDEDLTGAAGGVNYAQKHREIVERFGRFPHRNAILGRKSTPREIEFLREPGSGF